MPAYIEADRPLPAYFIGHAGVGLLFSETNNNKIVQANLREIGEEISAIQPRPKAVIVFSGHFEAGEIHGQDVIEVNVKQNTTILHDFVNDFHDSHPYVYEYDWPHADSPELATSVWKHFTKMGFKAKRVERGVDHGVWVPFKVMFPLERPLDVPVVQVSTFHGYDLASQTRLGQAVESLRHQGFLIIGSGMAVHSFASIDEIKTAPDDGARSEVRAKVLAESISFDKHVRDALSVGESKARIEALLELEKLNEFKRSHPTVEHFTPLLVAAGAGGGTKAESIGVNVVEPGMSYLNVRFS